MNLLRRFWIFVFVSFLFMRLTLAEYWGAENRFWLQWQRADVIGIVAVMVIAAAIMSVGYWILGLFGRIGKTVRDIGLLGFTLFYAKIAIVEIVFRENNAPIALSWLLNLVVLAAVVVSSFRLGKAVKLLDSACLILSPIVPIYVVSLLLAPPIPLFLPETPTLDKSSVEVRAEESRYPAKVFFFVFDALSYHRTFGDPARLIELPNLQKLANMSFVFSDAYSTANSTTAAVPGMLCGTNGAWSLMGSVPGLKTADGQVPVRDMRSLFQDMNERGYHTGVFGNALPYAVFFRNGVDVLTRRIMERPDMWERAFSIGKDVLSKHVAARAGRFLPEIEQTVKAGQITSCLAELNWLHEEALRRLQTQGQIFCYFHYLIPHYPLMYDSYGPVA
ncbi:MAG: sulfatase-like hydrolase/transferase, partial [Lentisphaerae bacterium]|nr:sulfatase-like hydrolase/transferase [Lentisphaerota bacterium]